MAASLVQQGETPLSSARSAGHPRVWTNQCNGKGRKPVISPMPTTSELFRRRNPLACLSSSSVIGWIRFETRYNKG